MAMSHLLSYDKDDDDDYIDMEVSSRAIFFSQSVSSPPFPKEFEFQMSTTSMEKDTTTSPADELFYKGKLLPLHLPPRLQMVEKILENSNPSCDHRRDTRELNPEEYVFEYSSQFGGFIDGKPKSSWTRKLNLIKQSSLSSKLKSSRAYLKSLFGKSGCSDDSCTVASKVADEVTVSKARESLRPAKKIPFRANPEG
ncbi:MEMBRANE-ASSOCIATED KINASE REGULATOR 3-RELATED [Salix koriyanagi]|uniref:MEMBRANE-ASSOCIATED KINASE REGULATOR 3-RELATED n=1 Tax=Salix koriyanagi TaxID=2511006 RepID=A0A9Q0WJK0_9ROSI|nr:MEMBRANE-ASSOCIATED KINASE REGULATOR 3-RELATED [Salix koriyanagi]